MSRYVTRLGFNIPHRGARRPDPPFTMNRDSWQSFGLTHWWPLAEPGDARDYAGVFDLEKSGPAAFIVGGDPEFHRFADFLDANNDYFDRTVVEDSIGQPPFTIAAWTRYNAADNLPVVNIADQSHAGTWQELALTSAGTLNMESNPASGSTRKGTASVNLVINTWGHVCGMVRTTANRSAYLDGGNRGDNTNSAPVTLLDNVTIGRRGDSSPSREYTGYITDVRYYNRALTDMEVAALADKHSRWELYFPLNRRAFFFEGDAVPPTGGPIPVKQQSHRRRRAMFQ